MDDERSPLPALEPGTPARMKQTLTSVPQSHAAGRGVIYDGDR